MYITVTIDIFINEFKRCDRGDNFSHEALVALFDYYEELEWDGELDIIAICCEWCEYTESELFEAYTTIDLDKIRDNAGVIELSETYLVLNV